MQLARSSRHASVTGPSARASLAAYCTHNARREQNPIESCILGEFGLLAVEQGVWKVEEYEWTEEWCLVVCTGKFQSLSTEFSTSRYDQPVYISSSLKSSFLFRYIISLLNVSGCLPVLVFISLYTMETGCVIPTRRMITLSDSPAVLSIRSFVIVFLHNCVIAAGRLFIIFYKLVRTLSRDFEISGLGGTI